MTISGLLMLGAAEVVDPKTEELLGYVYTVAQDKSQIQRWLLFKHPHNNFAIRPPSEAMAQWSLEYWQKHVVDLWRPNGYYVWAHADVYEYGETYDGFKWSHLPSVDDLPKPTFPDVPGASYQLDYYNGMLINVFQGDDRGHAYVVRGLEKESSIEYWLLTAQYQPAGNVHTAVVPGNVESSSLESFVAYCQSSWSPGAAFVITGCLNYHNFDAPFAP